jgi:hypothetical protein
MSKQSTCPACGSNESLSIQVSNEHDLIWRRGEYVIGAISDPFNSRSEPQHNDRITCGSCGWDGLFSELKVPATRYVVTLHWDTLDDDMDTDGITERVKRMVNAGYATGHKDPVTIVSVTLGDQA